MTVKPLETTPQPGYPDKYSVEAAKVIQTARPRRWLTVPLAGGVLTASILLGLSGCESVFVTDGIPLQTPTSVGVAPGVTPTPPDFVIMGDMPVPTPTQLGHIPLFEFGEGTGSIGCVAITAPVFLSEDEAFAILSAVFEEAGLTLDRASETLYAVTRPVTDPNNWEEKETKTVCASLNSDGILKLNEGIPMVFVSADDLNDWQRVIKDGETVMTSSVLSYNVKAAAKTLAENNEDLLVFYDPMASQNYDRWMSLERAEDESDEIYGTRVEAAQLEDRQAARSTSEGLLRQQAEAFLQWLRAEGII